MDTHVVVDAVVGYVESANTTQRLGQCAVAISADIAGGDDGHIGRRLLEVLYVQGSRFDDR